MKRSLALLLIGLLLPGCRGTATATRISTSVRIPIVYVRISSDASNRARLFVVKPDPGMGVAQLAWQGDLNNDGRPDLILMYPEASGSWGETPHAVYVAAKGGEYATLWGPDYAVELRVARSSTTFGGVCWRDLVCVERDGDAGNAALQEGLMKFDGARFQSMTAGALSRCGR